MLLLVLSCLSNTRRHIRIVFTSWDIACVVVRNAIWTNVWVMHIVLLLDILEGSEFGTHVILSLTTGRVGSSWRHALSHSVWVNSVCFWIIVLVLDRGDIPVSSDGFFVHSHLLLHKVIAHVTLALLAGSDGASELYLVVLQLTCFDFCRNNSLLSGNISERLLFEGKEERLDFADSRCHGLGKAPGIGHNHSIDWTLAPSVLGHRGKMAAKFNSFL